MASRTSSQGSSRSVPGTAAIRPSAIRPQPAAKVGTRVGRIGQELLGGHGADPLAALVRTGHLVDHRVGLPGLPPGAPDGRGRISSWVTGLAPWRCAVPRSGPGVVPPAMITTCSLRLIGGSGTVLGEAGPPPDTSDAAVASWLPAQVPMAWCTPAAGQRPAPAPAATGSPAAQHDRVVPARNAAAGHRAPPGHPAVEHRALGLHLPQPPVQVPLLHLVRDAVAEQPARGIGLPNTWSPVPGLGGVAGRRPARPAWELDHHRRPCSPALPHRAALASPSPAQAPR